MQDREFFASILLLAFLYGLNLLHGLFKQETPSIATLSKCKERFFIEIAHVGKRPQVLGFCMKPHLKILEERCGFRNGISIKILKHGSVICRDMSAYKKITLGIPISINREREYGLCAIPGIGPHIAREIVKLRKRKGRFNSLNEILQVRGIGKRIYNRILPYISL